MIVTVNPRIIQCASSGTDVTQVYSRGFDLVDIQYQANRLERRQRLARRPLSPRRRPFSCAPLLLLAPPPLALSHSPPFASFFSFFLSYSVNDGVRRIGKAKSGAKRSNSSAAFAFLRVLFTVHCMKVRTWIYGGGIGERTSVLWI